MRNSRWHRVLSIIIIIGLFLGTVKYDSIYAKASEKVDLNHDMSITVSVSDEVQERMDKLTEEDGKLVYDLYKLADIKESGTGFKYQVIDKYSFMSDALSKMSTAYKGDDIFEWSEISQLAMKNILGQEGSFVNEPQGADYTGVSFTSKQSVDKGLYLVIVRGSLTNSTVVKSMTVSNSDITDTAKISEGLATYTLLGTSTFTSFPVIVSVPAKVSDTGEMLKSTLEDGKWLYDVNVVLKMQAEPATGSIMIDKKLVDYFGNAENATFVFRVDTYYPDENTLYRSEVYSTTFNAAGTKSIKIDGLPIGSTVKVYEIYSGINYNSSIASDQSLNVVVKEDETERVEFTNKYNRRTTGGGGITNHFEYDVTDGLGNWIWFNKTDNTETLNGLSGKFLSFMNKPLDTSGF